MNRATRSAVLVLTLGTLAAACGPGSRISLWKVASGQAIYSPSDAGCGFYGYGTVTTTALNLGQFELWQEADGQLLLASPSSYSGPSSGLPCTLAGSALSCLSTTTQVQDYGNPPPYDGKMTQNSSSSITATMTGDLMTGTIKASTSMTCVGGCVYFTAPPSCSSETPFTAIRQPVDYVHSI